jgi:hypothetical protein
LGELLWGYHTQSDWKWKLCACRWGANLSSFNLGVVRSLSGKSIDKQHKFCQAPLPRQGAVLHPFRLPAEVPEPPGHRKLEPAATWARDWVGSSWITFIEVI